MGGTVWHEWKILDLDSVEYVILGSRYVKVKYRIKCNEFKALPVYDGEDESELRKQASLAAKHLQCGIVEDVR